MRARCKTTRQRPPAPSVVTQLTRYNATVHCCVHPLLSSVRLFHCCRGVIVVRMRNVQRGCDDVVWCRVSVCLSAHIDPLSLRAVTHGAAVRLRAVTSRGHLLRHNTTHGRDSLPSRPPPLVRRDRSRQEFLQSLFYDWIMKCQVHVQITDLKRLCSPFWNDLRHNLMEGNFVNAFSSTAAPKHSFIKKVTLNDLYKMYYFEYEAPLKQYFRIWALRYTTRH